MINILLPQILKPSQMLETLRHSLN